MSHETLLTAITMIFSAAVTYGIFLVFRESAQEKEDHRRHELFIAHQKGFQEGMNFVRNQTRAAAKQD